MSQRILLVDDEQDITTVLKAGLEHSGFQVDAFNNPEDAFSQFKPDYYDLVLLDIKMPKMNGFELCRELVRKDTRPKICFMTAYEVSLSEARSMFPNLKADGFIKKPMALGKIVEVVQNTLNNAAS